MGAARRKCHGNHASRRNRTNEPSSPIEGARPGGNRPGAARTAPSPCGSLRLLPVLVPHLRGANRRARRGAPRRARISGDRAKNVRFDHRGTGRRDDPAGRRRENTTASLPLSLAGRQNRRDRGNRQEMGRSRWICGSPRSSGDSHRGSERRLLGEENLFREQNPWIRARIRRNGVPALKRIYLIGSALLLVAFLALPASPDPRRARLSSTKSFVVDGKKFLIEKSKERPTNTMFADALREAGGGPSSNPISIPHGLRAEHSLRMESESGPVDIAFGSIDTRGPQMRHRMSSMGWECIEPGQGQAAVATIKKGRETTIVLLEEKEGKFLLLRRPE